MDVAAALRDAVSPTSGVETVAEFLAAVCDGRWADAYGLTQITWRHGFERQAFVRHAAQRWWRRLLGTQHRPVNSPSSLEDALAPLGLELLLEVGRPRTTYPMLEEVPVIVARAPRSAAERVRLGRKGLVREIRLVTVVREIEPFRPSENGEWGVNPTSVLRVTKRVPSDRFFTPGRLMAAVDTAETRIASS